MIGSNNVVAVLADWIMETVPALALSYEFEPVEKAELPDVVVVLDTSEVEIGNEVFPLQDIQQRVIQRYDLTVSFMVDNADPEKAAQDLRSYADALRAGLLRDGTLGQRV